jgi:hypothetical protein
MTMFITTGRMSELNRWINLAAAPSFAVMALLSIFEAPPLALCSAGGSMLPVDGMTAMYFLMSFFHLSPWLKLAVAQAPAAKGER